MDFIGMHAEAEFKSCLKLIQRKKHVQCMPQTQFLLDEDGGLLVDSIGRLENIAACFAELLDIIGMPRKENQLIRCSKSNRKKIEHYYQDNESIEMVSEMFSEDIRFLVYTLDLQL